MVSNPWLFKLLYFAWKSFFSSQFSIHFVIYKPLNAFFPPVYHSSNDDMLRIPHEWRIYSYFSIRIFFSSSSYFFFLFGKRKPKCSMRTNLCTCTCSAKVCANECISHVKLELSFINNVSVFSTFVFVAFAMWALSSVSSILSWLCRRMHSFRLEMHSASSSFSNACVERAKLKKKKKFENKKNTRKAAGNVNGVIAVTRNWSFQIFFFSFPFYFVMNNLHAILSHSCSTNTKFKRLHF